MSSSDSDRALQSDYGSDLDVEYDAVDTTVDQTDLARKRKREEAALDDEVAHLRSQLQQDGTIPGTAPSTAAQQAQHLLDLQAHELLQALAAPTPRLDALLRTLHTALASAMHGTLDWKAARGFCRDLGVLKKVRASLCLKPR